MLSSIRAFAKSPYALVIFVALLISFGLITPSVRDSIVPSFDTWIINADGRKLDATAFKSQFDSVKRQQEQRAQQQGVMEPISLEQIVRAGFDKEVLNAFALRLSDARELEKLGVLPSDKLVKSEIRKMTGFFNPITGAFDNKKFTDTLAENGLTPAVFQQQLSDDIASAQFRYGAGQGLRLPRAYTALLAGYVYEGRDGAYFTVDARAVGPIPPPSEQDIQAFIKANADKLMLPEFRVISLVRFSSKAAAQSAKIDEAEVLKRFNFAKDSLSSPEKRSLVQIPVKDQATATAVAQRLHRGEDPMAVARSLKVEPVIITDKPKSAISDRRVAEAAFKLADGQVSDPVQGDLSWAVIKVTAITPGHVATLEEARPQIEAAVRTAAGQQTAYAQSQAFEDAHTSGSTFALAAQKAGVSVVTLGPVSATGAGPNGQPVEGVDAKVMASAAGLPQGGESDIEEAGDGEWYAVRVEKVIAPAMRPMTEVRPAVMEALARNTLVQRLNAKGATLQERLTKGESIDSVAASVGSPAVHLSNIDRASARDHVAALGGPFLQAFLGSKPGAVFTAPAPPQQPNAPPPLAMMIGKVDAVKPGDLTAQAHFTEAQRPQLTMQYLQELSAQVSSQAMAMLKTRTDLPRARAALGITADQIAEWDPSAAAKDAGKSGKKKK